MWGEVTFAAQVGDGLRGQMWTFKDKGDRPVCLIPEATAVVRELYNGGWKNSRPKPVRVFYVARCYRYERPQAGRYREFTQCGVEILPDSPAARDEAKALLTDCLDALGLAYEFVPAVARGLSYYVGDGFEVVCPALGAQKQVAGGGSYGDGVGWAVGVDRLVLALEIGAKEQGE